MGLEPLIKDVEKAWFPISYYWWDRDQTAPIEVTVLKLHGSRASKMGSKYSLGFGIEIDASRSFLEAAYSETMDT